MIVISGSGHTSEVSPLLPAPPPHPTKGMPWRETQRVPSQEYTGQKPGRAENPKTRDNICVYVFMCMCLHMYVLRPSPADCSWWSQSTVLWLYTDVSVLNCQGSMSEPTNIYYPTPKRGAQAHRYNSASKLFLTKWPMTDWLIDICALSPEGSNGSASNPPLNP